MAIFRASLHNRGAWSAGWETRYIGAYPLNQAASLSAPSAVVTNWRLQNKISPTTTVYLDVLNAFNRRYDDIAYAQDYQVTPSSAAVPEGVTVHAGEPRQLRFSVRVLF